MFPCLKYLLLLILFTGIFLPESIPQTAPKPYFTGLNPGITIEPFYEKGEMDVSILPLVFQRSLTQRMDLRLTSILNLGIRNEGNRISHFGIESALPVFIPQKENRGEYSKGFFIAPVLSFTRNRLEAHNNIGLWVEPGYNLLFDNSLALSFGIQTGATWFNYDNGQTKWGNHFGFKFIIGWWR